MDVEITTSGTLEFRGMEGGGGETVINVDDQQVRGPTVNSGIWAQTDWEVEVEPSNPDVTLFDVRELEGELTDLQAEVADVNYPTLLAPSGRSLRKGL